MRLGARNAHSLIIPGVKIGNGEIIAARSVVVKNVAPYSIFGGNPAKIQPGNSQGAGESEMAGLAEGKKSPASSITRPREGPFFASFLTSMNDDAPGARKAFFGSIQKVTLQRMHTYE